MNHEQAEDITRRVCHAWFVMSGLADGDMPDLSDVSEGTAIAAAEIMRILPLVSGSDGTDTRSVTVDDEAIPLVLEMAAKAVRHGEKPLSGIVRSCVNAWLSMHGIPGLKNNLEGVSLNEAMEAMAAVRPIATGIVLSDTAVKRIYGIQ